MIAVVTLLRLRHEESSELTRYFKVLLVAVFVWTTTAFFDGVGFSPALSYTFSKLAYLGIPTVATAWFLLALEYSDRGDFLSRRLLAGLAVEPVLVNVVVWTNDLHELYWRSTGRKLEPR